MMFYTGLENLSDTVCTIIFRRGGQFETVDEQFPVWLVWQHHAIPINHRDFCLGFAAHGGIVCTEGYRRSLTKLLEEKNLTF